MKMAGGKKTRKTNNVLKAWVKFIKKVQKEENISYRDAMRRAKIRSDKGEKWKTMKGGDGDEMEEMKVSEQEPVAPEGSEIMEIVEDGSKNKEGGIILGGKRRSARRSVRRSARRSVRKSAKRSARRSSRRH